MATHGMQATKVLSRVCPTVVVVLGATGTGKSKLALDIARRTNSEIISADSMQVYKGLDIITNKVSPEELKACPHHVIDYVNPLSRYTVVDFRDKAVPIIDNLLINGKVPIIVGGTNYYIEALLWKVLLDPVKSSVDGLLLDRRGEDGHIRICKRSLADNVAPNSKHQRMDAALSGAKKEAESISDCSRNPHDIDYKDCISESTLSDLSMQKDDHDNNLKNSGVEATTFTGDEATTSTGFNETASAGNNEITIDNIQCATSEETVEILKTGVADSNPGVSFPNAGVSILNQDLHIDVEKHSSEELHDILKDVDPVMANKLHPKNRRKIIRSLQVLEQHHIPHSQLLTSQQATEGGGPLGGPLRYSNICVFWVQSDQTVLDERLDKRVDGMLERGLIEELSHFHMEYNQQRIQESCLTDELYSQGIFQSIGFKEFHDYLILSEKERETERGGKLKEQGIEKLKQVTRKYARKQLRWINNRFLKRPASNVPPVYSLDASDPATWDEMVLQPAMRILGDVMVGTVPNVEPIACEERLDDEQDSVTFVCSVCSDRLIVGQQQWKAHLKSRGHLKRARKIRKKELMSQDFT